MNYFKRTRKWRMIERGTSMKFIDLFAGIGGFHLGLEQAGHECVGWVEWDKFARQSYQAIHDGADKIWNEKDINDVKAEDMPKADLWAFGFPCQDISVAGKQGGFTNGKRSSLFFTVTGLLRELKEEDKPKYLLIENVKNLLSINKGWDFAKLQIELDEIGYDIEWDVLDSAEVVPQHRERIFIIGHLRGKSTRKVFPITRENGQTTSSNEIKIIGNTSDTGYRSHNVLDPTGISTTLMSRDYKGPKQVAVKQIGNISDSDSFGGNPQVGRVYDPSGISPTLNTMQGGGREPKVLVGKYERTDYGKQVRTDCESKKVKLHRSQIRHSTFKEPSISNTLTTVQKDNMIAIPVLTPDREKKRQNGRRFKENGEPEFTLTAQDRHGILINGSEPKFAVREATKTGYDVAKLGDSINFSQPNSKIRRGRVGHGVANTLTTGSEQATLIDDKGDFIKHGTKILSKLWERTKTENYAEWSERVSKLVSTTEILRQIMYEQLLSQDSSEIRKCELVCSPQESQRSRYGYSLQDLWSNQEYRYSSYRRKYSEQFTREFNCFVQKLPHEAAQKKEYMQNLWKTSKRTPSLQQALHQMEKIRGSLVSQNQSKWRIRKLTPLETWRLQGFPDWAFTRAREAGLSDSQLYKQAGNSVTVPVIKAIADRMEYNDNHQETGDCEKEEATDDDE